MFKFFILTAFLISTSSYAQNVIWGTKENPNPLKGIYGNIPYTVYVYEDQTYEVRHNNSLVLLGEWSETDSTVRFGRDAIANKVLITKMFKKTLCLEMTFKKGPDQFRYVGEIFCPKN